MSADAFVERFLKTIDEEIRRLSTPVLAGALSDYAAYKYHAGMIRGLNSARDLAIETLRPLVDKDRHRELTR